MSLFGKFTRKRRNAQDKKLASGLQRTQVRWKEQVASVFLGKKQIDAALLSTLQAHLLSADVGAHATEAIMQDLVAQVDRKVLRDTEALSAALQAHLEQLLQPVAQPYTLQKRDHPTVILMVGVNGVGKTTTIGKLAHRFRQEGASVLIAAGDTFRAAAIEQLQVWGQRHNVPVIAQKQGADSASVIFDAVQAAQARNTDVVLADTAGRLHTKENLMRELEKVRRVVQKVDATAPHEVWLVLDATTGQNALQQAKKFQESIGVTGIILTKLDGTAKGGIVFALARELGLPIRFIGVGEGREDLRPFSESDFLSRLFYNGS